jgi:cytochrome P450
MDAAKNPANTAVAGRDVIREMGLPPHLDDMIRLTDFDEINEVFQSRDFVQGAHTDGIELFHGTLLLLDGKEHFNRRRLESRLFSKPKLHHYEWSILQPSITRCLRAVRDAHPAARYPEADLVTLATSMLEQMTAAIVGIDDVVQPRRAASFSGYIRKFIELHSVEWHKGDHDDLVQEAVRIRNAFEDEFFADSVARRREIVQQVRTGDLDASEVAADLLTVMLAHSEEQFDDAQLLREAVVYLVGGIGTTSMAVTHMVNHLTAWFEQRPHDRTKVQDLDFLQAAAYESLRLHLPAVASLRIALKNCQLNSGRPIKAGDRIALLFSKSNRDPAKIGDDALEFNPHRGLERPIKPWGQNFGGGIHTCIGRQLVTGLSRSVDALGAGEDSTYGIAAQILAALYRAGVEMIPGRPPRYVESSFTDAFSTFPVRFTNL